MKDLGAGLWALNSFYNSDQFYLEYVTVPTSEITLDIRKTEHQQNAR